MSYTSYNDAHECESTPVPKLHVGDVILRAARGTDGFTIERGALVWSEVEEVRTVGGQPNRPGHRHFYKSSGIRKEIEESELDIVMSGSLSLEKGLVDGPGHTRNLIYMMETYEEVRQQMGECFELLSSLAGLSTITPESYAEWDDLRYTAYDFGFINGEGPKMIPSQRKVVLSQIARIRPAKAIHRDLFSVPGLGLHGGEPVYAPFNDVVGTGTKWLIGKGDAYRYLRFHMQPIASQLNEIQEVTNALLSNDDVWFDDLAVLVEARDSAREYSPEVHAFANHYGLSVENPEFPKQALHLLVEEQERWIHPMSKVKSGFQNIPVLAVAAGKGGVGKSTVAANLARSIAEDGGRPLLLDLDFYGPSAPVEFDLHDRVRIETGYIQPHHKDGVGVVSIGNMIPSDQALHWRGPVLEAFINLLCAHLNCDGYDIILLDCPPGTGDVQTGILERLIPSAALVVTTASELALADVRRAISSFKQAGVDVAGLIENMSEVELEDGRTKRLFGTKQRILEFCSEESIAYLGSLPFAADKTEILQKTREIAGTLYKRFHNFS